jgi:hypothetical protein
LKLAMDITFTLSVGGGVVIGVYGESGGRAAVGDGRRTVVVRR